MTVARNCTVAVVDDSGKPCANVKVIRGWSFGSPEKIEEKYTDASGIADHESRRQWVSLLGRLCANIEALLIVHGSNHIHDGYSVSFPENYTAEIEGDGSFKDVYENGRVASMDLSGAPYKEHYRVTFVFKKTATNGR